MTVRVRAVIGAVLVASCVSAAAAETRWDMPTPYPDGNFHTQNVRQFAEDVEKATNGALKIAIHPAGALVKHPDIKPAVRQGTAALGEILISVAASEAPVYALDSVPFLATGYDAARKLYAAQRPYLERRLAEEGLMLLYSVPWPPQGIYAKREIRSIADLKGLKFRTYNAITGRLATLVGAIPTQIEVPDLPAAFANGRVDVMITSASSGVNTKAEEYLTHYIDTQAWLPRNMVFVSKAALDALPEAEKTALIKSAKAAEERGWTLSIEEMTVKTNALKAAKIIVLPPSDELRSGLAKIGDAIAAEWAESAGPDGKAMLDAYRK